MENAFSRIRVLSPLTSLNSPHSRLGHFIFFFFCFSRRGFFSHVIFDGNLLFIYIYVKIKRKNRSRGTPRILNNVVIIMHFSFYALVFHFRWKRALPKSAAMAVQTIILYIYVSELHTAQNRTSYLSMNHPPVLQKVTRTRPEISNTPPPRL